MTEVTRLDFGDASFVGNGPNGPTLIGFERKNVMDLVASVKSGRLSGHQLPGLIATYNFVYLIVEGMTKREGEELLVWQGRDWRPSGFTLRQWDNLLNTISIMTGVTIIYTSNAPATAEAILNCYYWWHKSWDEHKSYLGFYNLPLPLVTMEKPSVFRSVLAALPGVGWERSAEIEKHFSSITEFVNAPESDYKKVPGIGKVLARRIKESLSG
jgi:ERCC4-type nuclease